MDRTLQLKLQERHTALYRRRRRRAPTFPVSAGDSVSFSSHHRARGPAEIQLALPAVFLKEKPGHMTSRTASQWADRNLGHVTVDYAAHKKASMVTERVRVTDDDVTRGNGGKSVPSV